jgi:hypothetical protein
LTSAAISPEVQKLWWICTIELWKTQYPMNGGYISEILNGNYHDE